MLSHLRGYTLHLIVWNIFILKIFVACLLLSTSASKFLFLVFLTIYGIGLLEITFSIKKEDYLAPQASSKDSSKMNLGNSAALFSKPDSDFILLFYLKNPKVVLVLCKSYALPPNMESNLSWEFINRETYSYWLSWGYTTSILKQGVGFQAPANFWLSVENTYCYTI